MNESVTNYMDRLGLTDPVRTRTTAIIDLVTDLGGQEPWRIFMSQYIDTEGTRILQDLWLFTDGLAWEAEQFLSSTDIISIPLSPIIRLYVSPNDYSPGKPGPGSRLTIDFRLSDRLGGNLRASGDNCDALWNITQTIFVHALKGRTG
jgi:hypothetical protein